MKNCFSKDLILTDLHVSSAEDAIRALSRELEKYGYVKPSYCDAVINREKLYSTGLPLEPVGVAIPHTDADHVNHMAIALGVLSSPVKFGLMGGVGEIDVDLVFLMALDNCTSQVTMLQSLAEFVNNEDFMAKIRKLKDKQAILDILNQELIINLESKR